MKHFALVAIIAFGCSPQWKVGNTTCLTADCRMLNAVASNSAEALRTVTINVADYDTFAFQIDYVWNAGTAVTITCTGSLNQGTSYGSETSTAVSGGTGTVVAYADSFAVTASANFLVDYRVRHRDTYQCVFAVTGGGANDTLTVYAKAWK